MKTIKPGFADGYRYIGRQLKNSWEKNSGKICTIAGTTGLFLTGLHACRKTYQIHDELVKNGKRIADARKKKAGEKRSTRIARIAKETAIVSAKTAKSYLPDIAAGALSGYAVSKGWHKEHSHYQQAAAMVGVVMADFMNYRRNVISEHGEETDRRYMTTKRQKYVDITPEKGQEVKATGTDEDGHVVELSEGSLRILYSRETTPNIWSESHIIRMNQLEGIENHLNLDLIWGGSYSVNDVRRYFYGRKGDIPEGNLFGRIWDPGDPEHPERGAKVNLHYEEDEEFMLGLKDWCWIIIDIDTEPLFELQKGKKDREMAKSLAGV